MQEIVENRQAAKKEFLLPNGDVRHRKFLADVHYPDGQGGWAECDFKFEDQATYWRMVKASHRLYISKNFLGSPDFATNDIILWRNRRNGANHGILTKPHSIRWVNSTDLSDMTLFRNAQDVDGVLTQDADGGKGIVRYTDAFGPGLHVEVVVNRTGVSTYLVIDSLQSLENPPTANHKLVFFKRYGAEGGLKVKARDKISDWDENSYYESEEGFHFSEFANPQLRSTLRPAHIRDSGGLDDQVQRIKVFWAKYGGKLWQAKVLPKQFLLDAVYPVRCDATASMDNADGGVDYGTKAVWATARDAANGTGFEDGDGATPVAFAKVSAFAGPLYRMGRGYWPIDVSGEGGGTVTAAALVLYAAGDTDLDNECVDMDVVEWTESGTPPTLAVADYSQAGTTVWGSLAIASWNNTNNTANNFALNATGMTALEGALGSSWFYLATRMDRDTDDNESTGAGHDYKTAWTSDNTSGGNAPYLEWTLAAGVTVPIFSHHLTKNIGSR